MVLWNNYFSFLLLSEHCVNLVPCLPCQIWILPSKAKQWNTLISLVCLRTVKHDYQPSLLNTCVASYSSSTSLSKEWLTWFLHTDTCFYLLASISVNISVALAPNLGIVSQAWKLNSNSVSSKIFSQNLPVYHISLLPCGLNLYCFFGYCKSLSGLPSHFVAICYPRKTRHTPKPYWIMSSLCSKPNGFSSHSE